MTESYSKVQVGEFFVAEDSDKAYCLVCQEHEQKQVVHFFRVSWEDIVRYVLAPDAEGAISQAQSGEACRPPATAVVVPFRIRGWGSEKF